MLAFDYYWASSLPGQITGPCEDRTASITMNRGADCRLLGILNAPGTAFGFARLGPYSSCAGFLQDSFRGSYTFSLYCEDGEPRLRVTQATNPFSQDANNSQTFQYLSLESVWSLAGTCDPLDLTLDSLLSCTARWRARNKPTSQWTYYSADCSTLDYYLLTPGAYGCETECVDNGSPAGLSRPFNLSGLSIVAC